MKAQYHNGRTVSPDSVYTKGRPWSTDNFLNSENVDYDDIKQAIKAYTTGANGQPVFIPGQGGEAKAHKEFEGGLYGQLLQQHARVVSRFRSIDYPFLRFSRSVKHVLAVSAPNTCSFVHFNDGKEEC